MEKLEIFARFGWLWLGWAGMWMNEWMKCYIKITVKMRNNNNLMQKYVKDNFVIIIMFFPFLICMKRLFISHSPV